MREIDIKITKAKIKTVIIDFEEDTPEVQASISCFTEEGKEVTTFSINTKKYYQGLHMALPLGMIKPIIKIGDELEAIIIKEINKDKLLLTK